METGAHLNAQGDELVSSLQGQLADSHALHRRKMEQIQTDTAAKASQLQSEVTDLGRRMAALNESVRRLESDLDAHLERIAGQIINEARTHLETAVALTLKDLEARSSNEVESSVNEMCGHLRTIQNRIEDSFSGSLKAQSEEAVHSIAQQFEDLAQQSVEKWRIALAKDLSAVANTLGQQLRQELEPKAGES
jgi:gas vesicle protein